MSGRRQTACLRSPFGVLFVGNEPEAGSRFPNFMSDGTFAARDAGSAGNGPAPPLGPGQPALRGGALTRSSWNPRFVP